MNSQKISGIIAAIAAILLLAADKIFAPVCTSTLELANGGVCMMRCHYYGIAVFFFGILLLIEAILMFIGQPTNKLPILMLATAVLLMLLSNASVGIGICAKADMMCHDTALWARISGLLAIVASGISLFVHKSQIPQAH